MIGTIATVAGYARAPKTTFIVRHPVRAMEIMAVRRKVRHTVSSPAFLAGVGAAALVVPVGLWLRRRANHG